MNDLLTYRAVLVGYSQSYISTPKAVHTTQSTHPPTHPPTQKPTVLSWWGTHNRTYQPPKRCTPPGPTDSPLPSNTEVCSRADQRRFGRRPAKKHPCFLPLRAHQSRTRGSCVRLFFCMGRWVGG